jgi:hypothetical protein
MKSFAIALFCFSTIALYGCSTVTIKQPLGEKLTTAELKELEGAWLHPDGEVLEVHSLADGRLAFASARWDDKEQRFKMESGQFVLTRAGALMFAAIPNNSGDRYTLALCKLEGKETVSFYAPAVDVFEKCVREHDLEGYVKQGENHKTVSIDASAENVLEFINRTGVEKCFVDTDEDKLVYRRVKKSEGSGMN